MPKDILLVTSIFGAAFSIFCMYEDIIEFSRFTNKLVNLYAEYVHLIFKKILAFFHFKITKNESIILTTLIFMIVFVLRVNIICIRKHDIEFLDDSNISRKANIAMYLFGGICFLPVILNIYTLMEEGSTIFLFIALLSFVILAHILGKLQERYLNSFDEKIEDYYIYKSVKVFFVFIILFNIINLASIIHDNRHNIDQWLRS